MSDPPVMITESGVIAAVNAVKVMVLTAVSLLRGVRGYHRSHRRCSGKHACDRQHSCSLRVVCWSDPANGD